MFALFAGTLCSCSSDEDGPSPPEEDNTGDVSVTIDTGGCSGDGSSSSPIVVENGKTLNMVLSQKSSYTNPDGSVITREPKANISLQTKLDTLYAKDIKTLTSVNGNPKVESTSSGSTPLRNQTLQTFNIGGQEITFDLGYEIYKIINSAGQTIEMPYIKLNPAQYGTASSAEKTDAKTRAQVCITEITLTPLNLTRGVTVTDSVAYNVSVSFNLDMESVNTKEENKQNLSFTVNYIGIVETSTEYPDPETSLSYNLNILGGTKNKVSPFTLTKGETLHLEWKQTVKHTYFSQPDLAMKSLCFEPTACVKLSALSDTIWAETAADFEKVTAGKPVISTTTGEIEQNASNQVFDIGGQKISAEWIYEICHGKMPDGEEISLPYLELGTLNLVSVSAVKKGEAEDVEEIGDKVVEIYEITAKFSQDLISQKLNDEVKQSFEYIVKYIGAVEVKLVDIKYRKGYQWYPAHDNIYMTSQLIVYRDRTYSNGVTFTDVYRSFLMMVGWVISASLPPPYSNTPHGDKEGELLTGQKIFWHKRNQCYVDTGGVSVAKTRVPDIETYKPKLTRDEYTLGLRGEYEKYTSLDNQGEWKFDPENPKSGWYFKTIERYRVITMEVEPFVYLREYLLAIDFPDRFLYIKDNIDERLIDFPEYWVTCDFDYTEERTTTSEGYPARVAKHECKAKYLGKDFYWVVIDTIYQTTPLQ